MNRVRRIAHATISQFPSQMASRTPAFAMQWPPPSMSCCSAIKAGVLSLYYDEDMGVLEIGEFLDVSESRHVLPVHGQALVRLRARLAEF